MLLNAKLGVVHLAFLDHLRRHVADRTWMYVLAPWAIDQPLQLEAISICEQELVSMLGSQLIHSLREASRSELQALGHACFDTVRPSIHVDRPRFLANYAACERRIQRAIEDGRPIGREATKIDSAVWIRFRDVQPATRAT
ncbi:hypothetical protein [Limimaricola cinnabarinus]|uniref:hypothetical protein n=1 Tax=Limimaricola cinnabarinus TaxID=1125964 RepID=UPI0024921813|nr:hypothetical protein [Limimaricola cinnabarinus]